MAWPRTYQRLILIFIVGFCKAAQKAKTLKEVYLLYAYHRFNNGVLQLIIFKLLMISGLN